MINFISNTAVVCITYEGVTNFSSLTNFDKKIIEYLPTTHKQKIRAITNDPAAGITALLGIPVANTSLIVIFRLMMEVQAVKYYNSTIRTMNAINMHYKNVSSKFNIQWDTYDELKKEDDTYVPVINDNDNDRKLIKWLSIFNDCIY